MKRTISAMIGKGSLNHNGRVFHAKNTDPERSHLNIEYCNEDIKAVYHEMFDEALEKYNAKQKRKDRMIPDYYEKIRMSKQEKPFHELIVQIGNKDDMGAMTEDGQLARTVLDEYMQDFQRRNPNLRVFSAHLHMDEATPHLHIDFVPFITGSKRGLETKVSLKQALGALGFQGGSRSDTEWNQWVNGEKAVLAQTMARHGIEWEQKGTHEKHLSVLDFEKQERAKEVAALEAEKAVVQEQVNDLRDEYYQTAEEVSQVRDDLRELDQKVVKVKEVEAIEVKPVPLSDKVKMSKEDYNTLAAAAQKYVVQEKQEGRLQKLLNVANMKIKELEQTIQNLTVTIQNLQAQVLELTQQLRNERSIEKKLREKQMESENIRLRKENQRFREVLKEYGLLPRSRDLER